MHPSAQNYGGKKYTKKSKFNNHKKYHILKKQDIPHQYEKMACYDTMFFKLHINGSYITPRGIRGIMCHYHFHFDQNDGK